MKTPLLSISVPTYNRAHYLEDCLNSVKIQLDLNPALKDLIEVVVSDNASTDTTKEVAEKYRKYFTHYTYVVNEKNLGFDPNVLSSVKNATGTYCWYLADDDVMVNGSLDYVVEKLLTNKYDVITVESAPITSIDYRDRKVFNDSDIFQTTDPDNFFYGNDSLGAVSNLIFNRELWMKCLDVDNYLKYWLYYEVVLKMFVQTKKPMLNVLQKLVFTGQDCRWAENGAELGTFVNSNLLLERMISFGFDKKRLERELDIKGKLLPIMLLRAKGHGLACTFDNYKFMYTNMKRTSFLYMLLASIIFCIPNSLVVFARDNRKHLPFKILRKKLSAITKGMQQRLFYIKNYKHDFSLIYLLPGSLREKLGKHTFFRTLIRHNKDISLTDKDGFLQLHAGKFNLRLPVNSFYETDFFDIMYPRLNVHNATINKIVYQNPYYVSEGSYEKFGVTLSEGDYVVDAGANIGMFSVIASGVIGTKGIIFAFEPLKEISDILEENAARNNCTNIITENKIIGEVNKDVDFYYNLETSYNAASKTIKHVGDKVAHLEQITLDEYVARNNITKIDFIKADIEGAERDLLKGGEETIKRFKPKLALRTYHLPDDKEVLYALVKQYVPEYNVKLDNKTLYAWI